MRKIVWSRLFNTDKMMVMTKMGGFPNEFNLWLGHTNFDIDELVLSQIEETEGVESVDVFSPYRMRVGIGLMFDEVNVRLGIQKALGVTTKETKIHNEDVLKDIESITKQITSEYWAIYISPNGKIDYVESDVIDEILDKVEMYEEAEMATGGYLMKSWI